MKDLSLEEQIKLHKELSNKIDELEDQKKILGLLIMQSMGEKTLRIPGYVVRCMSRLSFKLSLEEARAYGAVKMEETVDKEKIKALCKDGRLINGVTESHYIQISTT